MDSVKEHIHRSTISVQFYSRDNLQFRSKCKRVVLYVIRVTTTSDDSLSLPVLSFHLFLLLYIARHIDYLVWIFFWFLYVRLPGPNAIGINQKSVCFKFNSISLHFELDRYELSIFGCMLIFVCFHVIAYTHARCAFRYFIRWIQSSWNFHIRNMKDY